jgi:hypothetical protein
MTLPADECRNVDGNDRREWILSIASIPPIAACATATVTVTVTVTVVGVCQQCFGRERRKGR